MLCILPFAIFLLPKKNLCEYPGKEQCTTYDGQVVIQFTEKQPLGTYILEKVFKHDFKVNYNVEIEKQHNIVDGNDFPDNTNDGKLH